MVGRSQIKFISLVVSLLASFSVYADRTGQGSGFMWDSGSGSDRPQQGTAPDASTFGPKPFEYSARQATSRRGSQLVSINGCSTTAGFKTAYGKVGAKKAPRCDARLDMAQPLADFFNKNLNRCLDQAANNAFGHGTITANLNHGGNTVYHDGCIGDSAHQHTGSWHNEGLALDVNAFKVGDQLLRYSDALNPKTADGRKTASFFNHFRKCWSDAVVSSGSTCSAGAAGKKKAAAGRAGSIGNEHSRHHHHLHLSLPCKNLTNGRATYTADIWSLFFPEAVADDVDGDVDLPEVQYFTSQVKTTSGNVEVTIEERQGESISADTSISLAQSCRSGSVEVEAGVLGCAFDGIKDLGTGKIELSYRTGRLVDGVISCSETQTKIYELPCH